MNPLHAHWKRSATILNLRGPAGDADFRQRVEAALGLPLPTTACTTQACAHRRIVWVGPDDWFVIAPADDGGTERALRSALAGQAHALTDVGSGYVVLRLAGEAVRDILAHGCPLDLHPRAFTPGTSAGSHFFKASIWLWRPDDAPAFELLIRRSFANYVSLVLKRCCRECGLAESWSA
ncbi:MAG: sarcosine oxidase subunit gamma family protein [Burkholderiaceae bacterium]